MSFLKLDLSSVQTSNTVPEGTYKIRCTDVKVEDKPDDKQFVLATMQIMEGDQEGRKIFERFTIRHPNPKAVQVGLGKLKRFVTAAGHKNPNEVEVMELSGMECTAVVKVEAQEGFDPRNNISSYKKTPDSGATTSSSPF